MYQGGNRGQQGNLQSLFSYLLQVAKCCARLEKLHLQSCRVTNETVNIIANSCPWLESLRLDMCNIQDKPIINLAEKVTTNLKELFVKHCKLTGRFKKLIA